MSKDKQSSHSVFFNGKTGTKVIHSDKEKLDTVKPQVKTNELPADGNTTKTFKFASDGTLKKTKFKCKPCGKFFLHHKSHLNDPTL